MGTKRDDISDVLLTSLVVDNSFIGLLDVGEEFGDSQGGARWVEDALNPLTVKCTSTLPDNGATTTMTFSTADAAVLEVGMVLQEDVLVGQSEQIQIITKNGQTMTVTRGYAGTTPAAHQGGAANVVYRIINSPTYENSDLGPDKSRPRIAKQNLINRWEGNVNLSSEQIIRTQRGYAPGVTDELTYQFGQRLIEKRREINQAFLFSAMSGSVAGGDYNTMGGLIPWLDGTLNATTTVVTTNESINPATNAAAIGIINSMVKSIFRVGGFSNAIIAGPNVIEQLGALFAGQIRIDQNDRNRGYYAQFITPSMSNEHRLINEAYLPDTNNNAMAAVLDLSRCRIRPFADSLMYVITAPSFRDGDAVRFLIKATLEVRNTGSDAGQSHILHKALQVV